MSFPGDKTSDADLVPDPADTAGSKSWSAADRFVTSFIHDFVE